ncbi:MAG: DEAD/DEAH box helicase [Alphaproteobacteria bacterium]|nr:DEAD/DEAH box helicase [Alphaproteobacteria bacterium]
MSLPIDPAAEAARAALDDREPVVFLTGRAGTGKSHFIRTLLKEDQHRPQVVLAPTGLAAMNIGGQTVHSFFGLPPRLLLGFKEKPNWFFTQNVRRLSRIVVDEISMLRADTLDAMDSHLRAARKSVKPFGGVQMLLVGDFYQLPPVVRGDEGRMMEEAGYGSPFAFSAHVLRDAPVSAFELTEMRRQTDSHFISLLQSIRDNNNVRAAVDELNAACCDAPPLPVRPVLLCATNAVADAYNLRGLQSLPGDPKVFEGGFKGELPKSGIPNDRLPAPMTLALKRGARVIFTQNDPAGRWVNGTLGAVIEIEDELVRVLIDGVGNVRGDEVDVPRSTWPQTRWQWDEKAQEMNMKEEWRYVQFPLAAAWAITIHKAQGMTLDAVEVDLGRGAFAAGQTYVALSRARSMAGLRLTRPLQVRDVQVDEAIAEGLARWVG